jgi:hypothetical protein
MIHAASVLSPTADVTLTNFEAMRKVLNCRLIGVAFGTHISLILTPCDFYLWGSLRDKVYKTNSHTLEELRYNIRLETLTISGEELQRFNNNVFCRYTESVSPRQQQFRHLL